MLQIMLITRLPPSPNFDPNSPAWQVYSWLGNQSSSLVKLCGVHMRGSITLWTLRANKSHCSALTSLTSLLLESLRLHVFLPFFYYHLL